MSLSTYQAVLMAPFIMLLKAMALLLFLVILTIITIALYRLYFHPLSSIPGPRLAALSNIWHAHHARSGRMYTLGKTLHQKYGPVVRVGPNELWINTRDSFKVIYSAGSGFEKSDFYLSTVLTKPSLSFSPVPPRVEVQHADTLDLLSERYMPRYRTQRRLIGPVYQLSSLKRFEPQIDAVLDSAVAKLKGLKGEEVDVKEWMHIIAVECLGAVVLGWSPGYIKAGSDGGTSRQGYQGWKRKSVFGLFPVITKLGFLEGAMGSWIGKGITRWFSNIWNVTFATPKNFKPFFTPVYQKSSKRIAAALKGETKDPRAKASKKKNKPPKKEVARPKDLLEHLIQLHKAKPEQFTETYLRRMATTNFGAGHETLCSALTACLGMIGMHEAVQERVAEEVGTYLRGQQGQDGGSGSASRTVPFDATAKELKYTLAAIKEAQRLHPVIAMSLSRTVPQGEGVTMHGHYIPPGTTVGCNPVALHRNPEIFGLDADSYNPSRWLSASTRSSYMYSGPSSTTSGADSGSTSDSTGNDSQQPTPEDLEHKRLREMLHLNLTYGGGARTCPGRHLAELIVWKVVPRLVAEFKVEVTHMPEEKDMERYFMSMLTGVKVRFLERENEEGGKMEDGDF